jgi:adenylate cyclase
MEQLRLGDVDGAIESAQAVVAEVRVGCGDLGCAFDDCAGGSAVATRWRSRLNEVQVAIYALAALPTDPGLVRNMSAAAPRSANQGSWRRNRLPSYRDRYRALATSLGFEGQMKWADAMA